MAVKLTLQETVGLLIKNGFPVEIIPGKTERSVRHHLLVIHEDIPEFYIVFGDEAHGSLLDSVWVSSYNGAIRVKEADLRALIEKPAALQRWTREMPAAPNPVKVDLTARNRDTGAVTGRGTYVGMGESGPKFKLLNSDLILELNTDEDFDSSGAPVNFEGTYRFPATISKAKFIK